MMTEIFNNWIKKHKLQFVLRASVIIESNSEERMRLWNLFQRHSFSRTENHAYAKAPVKDKIGMEWKKPLRRKKAKKYQLRTRTRNKGVSQSRLQCTKKQTTG